MNDNELKGLIAKYLKIRVRSHGDVIKATGISKSTYYRYMADMEQIRLSDLRAILNYLKVPKEERFI